VAAGAGGVVEAGEAAAVIAGAVAARRERCPPGRRKVTMISMSQPAVLLTENQMYLAFILKEPEKEKLKQLSALLTPIILQKYSAAYVTTLWRLDMPQSRGSHSVFDRGDDLNTSKGSINARTTAGGSLDNPVLGTTH
jgi:hypothetical protein